MGNGVSLCNTVGLKRELTILCVGLDNAGKTCAARSLVGESIDNTTPTIGFSKHSTKLEGVTVNIYDLGGGARIREIWNNYFAETHGIIYVFDSSDSMRLLEARDILKTLMTHPLVRGKPLLLLANKQDNDEAMDEVDVSESLHLEELANECRSPTRIEICSAIQGTGKNMDPSIRTGFQWLIASVLQNFDAIHQRVVDAIATQKVEEEKKREERKERIRKIERNDNVSDKAATIEEQDALFERNPFRPVNEILESWNLPGAVFTEVGEGAKDINAVSISDNPGHFPPLVPHYNEENDKMSINSHNRIKHSSLPPLKPTSRHEFEVKTPEKLPPSSLTISKSIFSSNNRTAPLPDEGVFNILPRVSEGLPPLK